MKKFKVLFKRSNGEIRLLGYTGEDINQNLKNSSKMINRYLKKFPNFKHYYTRIDGPTYDTEYCKDGERLWIYDVGSWSEFFYVVETKEDWNPSGLENIYENYSEEFFTLT